MQIGSLNSGKLKRLLGGGAFLCFCLDVMGEATRRSVGIRSRPDTEYRSASSDVGNTMYDPGKWVHQGNVVKQTPNIIPGFATIYSQQMCHEGIAYETGTGIWLSREASLILPIRLVGC